MTKVEVQYLKPISLGIILINLIILTMKPTFCGSTSVMSSKLIRRNILVHCSIAEIYLGNITPGCNFVDVVAIELFN